MALLYLDTSALVKVFVEERGSTTVAAMMRPEHGHSLNLLALTRVEAFAALTRRERAGDLEPGFAGTADAALRAHMVSRCDVQEVTDELLEVACSMVQRHGLRAYDALQFAGCLAVASRSKAPDTWFVTADRELVLAASGEGLHVVDPGEEDLG